MKLKEFELKEGNHFIAMEYYGLILNRTFLILLTQDYLIGLKVNGLVSVQGGIDPFTVAITKNMAIQNNLENPYSYIKSNYLRKLENLDVLGAEILAANSSNFKVNRIQISGVTYNKRKKWGMGYYPHDGRVYIKTIEGKKREFIILGAQSGEKIVKWITR